MESDPSKHEFADNIKAMILGKIVIKNDPEVDRDRIIDQHTWD